MQSEIMASDDNHQALARLSALLEIRYRIPASNIGRVAAGQGTINFRAESSSAVVFVKQYPRGVDLGSELKAIGLSELATQARIPTAPIISNVDDERIDRSTDMAVSVWEWMPGATKTEAHSNDQLEAIGARLGEIHRLFAVLPESGARPKMSERWWAVSTDRLNETLGIIVSKIYRRIEEGISDGFDKEALPQLAERRDQVALIPSIISELSTLTSQVLHGDYSLPNLLFDGDALSAVLDFRPPDPFLVSYELGRVAFQPDVVTGNAAWLQAASLIVEAYRARNPSVAAADIINCGRVALLQLIRSFYGVKEHYFKPGLIQSDLDRFWSLRHQTAKILQRHLPEIEDMLRGIASRSPLPVSA